VGDGLELERESDRLSFPLADFLGRNSLVREELHYLQSMVNQRGGATRRWCSDKSLGRNSLGSPYLGSCS
jgi:hypothetical protein